MGKRKGSFKKDHRGMTLVELLCSVAIFACITAVIGSVMVVTAKTYRNGTTEAALQEESQLAVNVIEGLIVDAGESVNYAYKISGGDWTTINTASEAPTGADMKLEIVNNSTTNDKVDIIYYASANRLMYQKTEAGVLGSEYLLAENVEDFGVDVSKYNATHNVVLDMKLEKENRKFEATYNVTSRNDNVVTAEYTPSEWVDLDIGQTEMILEPCQVDVPLTVIVTASEGTSTDFTCSLHANSCTGTTATAYPEAHEIRINVDKNETGSITNNMYLVVESVETKEDGFTPIEQKVVPIYIRRVNGIDVEITQDDASQNEYAIGTTYTISSAITGTPYLAAKLGEAGYKNAYAVDWDYTLTIGGTAVTEAVRNTYFELVEHDATSTTAAYVEAKLLKEFPAGGEFKVTGTAMHPNGVNKSGLPYDTTVVDSDKIVRTAEILPNNVGGDLFKRGQDYLFADHALDTSLRDSEKQGDSSATINYFWRYREIYDNGTSFGAWSEYRLTDEGGTQKKINAAETYCLAPDKAYEIEYIYAVYSPNSADHGDSGKLYWPHNTDLFLPGTGFEKYTAKWDEDADVTLASEYTTRYRIGATDLYFQSGSSECKFNVPAETRTLGSLASPLAMDQSTYNHLYLTLGTKSMEFGHFQSKIQWKLEKYNGSIWEEVSASGFDLEKTGYLRVKGIQSTASGTYRLKAYLTEYAKVKMAGTVAEPEYEAESNLEYNLYDESTGNGIIYLKFN
ncbi:MAG: type II secretion system protein [Lachnospiraceae bacterium]|nr:type II secretion system protein [Lachnospiraceae bacterium]